MDIDYSVYLVTDQFDYSQEEFLKIIEEAIIGGTTIVQLREKKSSTRDFYNLALKVKQITDKYDVPLIINDRLDIAQAVDSAGVHLGQDDMPCKVAREILGEDKIIGISAENYADAKQGELDGANYLGIGAIVATSTKTDCSVISREDLELVKENINIPRVAIGGVKEHNTRELINDYSFDGVAIVSAIMLADNPNTASENFSKLVKE
ncbi:MAG: thiamine phosphate synthase [Methanosphaera sp.]|nr:thiamine phosphate synthase [Methanosphaera sp.]